MKSYRVFLYADNELYEKFRAEYNDFIISGYNKQWGTACLLSLTDEDLTALKIIYHNAQIKEITGYAKTETEKLLLPKNKWNEIL